MHQNSSFLFLFPLDIQQENISVKESENLLGTAARFFYSSQSELLTVNFYPIVILATIIVVGKKRRCMVNNFYRKFQCYGP